MVMEYGNRVLRNLKFKPCIYLKTVDKTGSKLKKKKSSSPNFFPRGFLTCFSHEQTLIFKKGMKF